MVMQSPLLERLGPLSFLVLLGLSFEPLNFKDLFDAHFFQVHVSLLGLVDLAEEHDVVAPHDENAPGDISVLLAHVDALDGLVQDQVGELVDAPQVADQGASVPQEHE
uniref:Putative secreted protein n=1 Tax=Ixodes ricinus TaxID=34613 RepID=A0A6B0UC49_IXORI